jgi:hypothetical protein
MHLLSLLMLSFILQSSPAVSLPVFAEKIINITVDARANIAIDGVAIEADMLAKQLQQRLWRSYMVNGKMADAIHLRWDESISDIHKKSIIDAIKEAQEKALTVLCLHKHKKKFENINSRQHARLKKQFPILFQQSYLHP